MAWEGDQALQTPGGRLGRGRGGLLSWRKSVCVYWPRYPEMPLTPGEGTAWELGTRKLLHSPWVPLVPESAVPLGEETPGASRSPVSTVV